MTEDALDPTSLTVKQLVVVLKSAGWTDATEEAIQKDLSDGCPTRQGGSISFVAYVAWLLEHRRG